MPRSSWCCIISRKHSRIAVGERAKVFSCLMCSSSLRTSKRSFSGRGAVSGRGASSASKFCSRIVLSCVTPCAVW